VFPVPPEPAAEAIRLGRSQQGWVYGTFAVLAMTGLAWLLLHHFVSIPGEFGVARHPLEIWSLRLHGAAAMVFLVVIGTLLPLHVRRAWRMRRNLATGIAMLAVNATLVATGYALYYAGSESLRSSSSVIHWGVGLGAVALMATHIVVGRARRSGAGGAAKPDRRSFTARESLPLRQTK
jgi:cation transport ATPase